jgi:hypothetical protein
MFTQQPLALDMPSSCRLTCAPALLIGLDKSKRIFTSNTAFLNFGWLFCAVVGQYPMLLVRVERGLTISGHKNYGNYITVPAASHEVRNFDPPLRLST